MFLKTTNLAKFATSNCTPKIFGGNRQQVPHSCIKFHPPISLREGPHLRQCCNKLAGPDSRFAQNFSPGQQLDEISAAVISCYLLLLVHTGRSAASFPSRLSTCQFWVLFVDSLWGSWQCKLCKSLLHLHGFVASLFLMSGFKSGISFWSWKLCRDNVF